MGEEIKPPLIIVGLPRSGTSMMAGIFVEHGYWVGYSAAKPTEEIHKNHLGYYENKRFAQLMVKFRKKGTNHGGVARWGYGFDGDVQEVLRREEYDGGPWLVKFGVSDIIPWKITFPDATVVVMDRRLSAIRKSSPQTTRLRVKTYRYLMSWAEKTGGFRVDYDRIVDGDYSQLVPIFEKEGVMMREKTIKRFVRPELRRYR